MVYILAFYLHFWSLKLKDEQWERRGKLDWGLSLLVRSSSSRLLSCSCGSADICVIRAMNSSRHSPSRSLPLCLLEALNVSGSPSLHYRVSEETCRFCPKLFAKRSKISFSFTVKKLEQKEKRFMFPDSWANGSSFKIVASRVKVTFLPSILTLRLLFNRCHTAPLPSFSSPFQHVRLLWTWCLVPESDTDFRSSQLTLRSLRCVVEERKSLAAPFARVWLRVFTAKTLRWAQFSARCFVSAQILSDCQVKSGSATDSYSKIKYISIKSCKPQQSV